MWWADLHVRRHSYLGVLVVWRCPCWLPAWPNCSNLCSSSANGLNIHISTHTFTKMEVVFFIWQKRENTCKKKRRSFHQKDTTALCLLIHSFTPCLYTTHYLLLAMSLFLVYWRKYPLVSTQLLSADMEPAAEEGSVTWKKNQDRLQVCSFIHVLVQSCVDLLLGLSLCVCVCPYESLSIYVTI